MQCALRLTPACCLLDVSTSAAAHGLDFDADQLSGVADFAPVFDKIAENLMSNCVLLINNKHRYRFCEVEFYYHGGVREHV